MNSNCFKIIRNKGFHLPVGKYVVSVQFGYGNYCDNYDLSELEKTPRNVCSCENAEVAILEGGMFVTSYILQKMGLEKTDEDVISYATPEFVVHIIAFLAKLEEGINYD